jgi:uncharacterized protein YbjT (DUF2867 family)
MTAMSDREIIAVIGATGAQGGGLVRAIVNDAEGGYQARAITRMVDSDKAQALARSGAEVVAADLDDPESLKRAFTGAHGAYCVTNYWEHFSPEKELAQAAALAQAAKSAGVQHVIWSTLEDTRKYVPLSDNRMPTLMGKYKVPHFDAKGEANHFFTDLGLPATMLLTAFYWDNFISFGMGPKRGEDGKLVLALPMGDKKLPGIVAEDIGRCAYGIFQKHNEFVGKSVGIAGEHLTGAEIAAAYTQALGEEVTYYPVPFDVYRGLGFPGADDLGNMFQFKHDFNQMYCASRSIERTRALSPELQTLSQWLETHSGKLA